MVVQRMNVASFAAPVKTNWPPCFLKVPLPTLLSSVLLLSPLLIGISTSPSFADSQLVAVLNAYAGHVDIERSNSTTFQTAIPQDALYQGDTIRTDADGEAEILFTDGAEVKISHNSAIRITPNAGEEKSKSFIQAIVGVIWAHLRPGQTIAAPTANIVVRGTEVSVTVLPNGTTQVTVIKGDVDFSNGMGSVNVGENEQSTAEAGRAPTAPITVDATGLISWTADVVGLPLDYETPQSALLPKSVPGLLADEQRCAALTVSDSTNAQNWNQLGELQRAVGDAAGAINSFSSAAQLVPSDTEAHIGLALTYLSQNESDLAEKAIDPIEPQPAAIAVAGLIRLESGHEDDAEKDLGTAVNADSSLYSARALLALAYLSRNDIGDADSSVKLAVKTAPDSALVNGIYSTVLLFEKQYGASLKYAREAYISDPSSPFVLLVLGRESMELQNYTRASADFEKAAAVNPRLWLLHQELAESYLQLGLAHKADEEYRIAVLLNPSSAMAHTGLGRALEAEGDNSSAEEEYKTAIVLAPLDPSVRYFYASFLIDRGELDAAIAQIDAVKKQASNFGLLYSKLAEIYLYKQKIHEAEVVARAGVKALPQSATAHYELGRVYSEEQHTYQAEQEFRIATTLDPYLESARYALGVTEEKTESGLLSTFGSIFDAALIGSPASSTQLNDLETPGANERIQAEVFDPTAIQSATKSYGDTELDVVDGGNQSNATAVSNVTSTKGSNGVVGVDGDHQYEHGDRDNDDSTLNKASVVAGQKIWDGTADYVFLGDYEQTSKGNDVGVTSSSSYANQRYDTQLTRLTTGVHLVTPLGQFSALIQGDHQLDGTRSQTTDVNPDYFVNHLDDESLDGELRWDGVSSGNNQIIAGLSYGERRRSSLSNSFFLPEAPLALGFNVQDSPVQAYLRDVYRPSVQWSFTGQIQYVKEEPVDTIQAIPLFDAPTTVSTTSKTFLLPDLIAGYTPDNSTVIRVRYQRLGATLNDFGLLDPTDIFLTSYVLFPQTSYINSDGISRGTSAEAEIDKTLANASFLSIALFDQHLAVSQVASGTQDLGPYPSETNSGLQASYQGALNSRLTYFILGQYNRAHDDQTNELIAQMPVYNGICTLQSLNTQGIYEQVSYYAQTSRIVSDSDRSVTGGFGILDLRIGRRIGLRSNLFIELNDATNVRYDILGVLQPGRELRAGVSQRY